MNTPLTSLLRGISHSIVLVAVLLILLAVLAVPTMVSRFAPTTVANHWTPTTIISRLNLITMVSHMRNQPDMIARYSYLLKKGTLPVKSLLRTTYRRLILAATMLVMLAILAAPAVVNRWNPTTVMVSHYGPTAVVSHWNPTAMISHWNPQPDMINHYGPTAMISRWNPQPGVVAHYGQTGIIAHHGPTTVINYW